MGSLVQEFLHYIVIYKVIAPMSDSEDPIASGQNILDLIKLLEERDIEI